MNKKLLVTLIVVLLLSLGAFPVLATTPDDSVQGRWCYGDIIQEEIKTVGGNVFYNLDDSGAWIGTFDGYSSDDGRLIVHALGYTLFKSKVTFESVTVDGKEGGLKMRVNGWLPSGADLSEYEGRWVIIGATGELAGLRGRGTWGGVELYNPECSAIDGGKFFASVPYSGYIHFESE
jgi:hypothetical protein